MAKEYKPPKMINGMVKLFNRAGIGRSMTLTTTGRSSGEPRDVPVSPIEYQSETYLVAPYGSVGWVLNARANPAAELRSGNDSRQCRLVEVTDEAAPIVQAYWERESFPRAYMDVPESPDLEDFQAATSQFPVFRVEYPA